MKVVNVMRYKWIVFVIAILAVAVGGLYLSWFYFVPVPTPEQIVWQIKMQIKEEEEERLKKEAEEDAKLLRRLGRTRTNYRKKEVRSDYTCENRRYT